jgi:hypothetical protein
MLTNLIEAYNHVICCDNIMTATCFNNTEGIKIKYSDNLSIRTVKCDWFLSFIGLLKYDKNYNDMCNRKTFICGENCKKQSKNICDYCEKMATSKRTPVLIEIKSNGEDV